MADFTDAFLDLLPEFSSLRSEGNLGRLVIDRTVGEWFDRNTGISFVENLFLNTASGGFLDLFGADYGVPRKLNEGDDDYRNRIVFEKLEYLTVDNLRNIYGLDLYTYISMFDARENCLTSDNPYLSNQYMSIADEDLQNNLNNKFVLDNNILWLNDDKVDYILDRNGFNIILEQTDIYTQSYLSWHFSAGNSVSDVRLNLPKLVEAGAMFAHSVCESVFLNAPNLTEAGLMFSYCSKLVNVEFNFPLLENFDDIFRNSNNLKTINVTIPDSKVNGFKNYVLGLNLENLTSLVINGVEYL